MSAPFLFSLRFSPLLKLALFVAHAAPVLCVTALEIEFALRWAALAGCIVSAGWYWHRWRGLEASSLAVSAGGELSLLRDGMPDLDLELLAETRDLGWLIVLVWKDLATGNVGRVALTRDGLPAEQWRALRRHVRWRIPTQPQLD